MALSSSSASTNLDFEALFSRNYQPARVAQLQVKPLPFHHHHHNDKKKKRQQHEKSSSERFGDEEAAEFDFDSMQSLQQHDGLNTFDRAYVLRLVAQTPAYLKHLTPAEREKVLQQQKELLSSTRPAKSFTASTFLAETVPSKFHPVEMLDWESQIDWGEGKVDQATDDKNNKKTNGETNSKNHSHADTALQNYQSSASITTSTSESTKKFLEKLSPLARSLLEKKRNHFLDNLDLEETVIVGYADPAELARKAAEAPLILELGVTGQSVAHKVYQSTELQAQHPTPAVLQYVYQARVDREWAGAEGKGGSSIDISEITKNADRRNLSKAEYNALIEARSKKREQMAKDKTNRVTAALGTLALGGGKGRTITSSLMGPGGTERTGRPTRMNAAGTLEMEYIEQIDLVTSHALVRDLSRVLLRQFHRPKLPLSVVRQDLSWQFQIRFSPKNRELQANAAGQHQGYHRSSNNAVAGSSIRNESDLSPSDGKLVVVEYSEEKPPVQLSKGMCVKIINYFRGDKAHCPVSAGGGDRPARRKRNDEPEGTAGPGSGGKKANSKRQQQQETYPRLNNMAGSDSILDWIGPLPKKPKDHSKMGSSLTASDSIDILPEGVTETLHPNVHGPFLGEVQEGCTLTGLISNLFVAPMFRHEPECTDFLMILTPPSGATRPGQRESMGAILRDFPKSVYTAGQTEPRTRVHAPTSPGEKNFIAPYVSYQIARAITRSQSREGHGLRLDELQARVLPNLELPGNAFRQRLKAVAIYDKNTQIWTTKQLGFEGYQGVEALGRSIAPEGVAAFETACAASRRLADLGIHQLFSGNSAAVSVGVCMVYLAGQLNANKELRGKMKRLLEISRSQKDLSSLQILFYEKAYAEIETIYKIKRHKHEVAQFINEELQLAPWHLTGEFIDVHKKAEGTGMMKLTGLGDPSGTGEGFSFLREVDSKPSKSVGNAALNAQVKKITGTEDDLRKLTMQQMASLLRSYGMAQKQIDTLKRWDRVHCIRDLSTKAASDGIGDGYERFARGEKLKLSEMKQMYRDRIQEIWRRQIAALSSDAGDKGVVETSDSPTPEAPVAAPPQSKPADESESESEDDDELANILEEEMMDQSKANQLVAAQAHGGKETEADLGQLRAATQDSEMNKDARDLFALRRQREEEKAAQGSLLATNAADLERHAALMADRKVIRKRITRTHPDGRQTTTFKFVLQPGEVAKIESKLSAKKNEESFPPAIREWNYRYGDDEKPPGHAMFEDDDNFEYSSRGRLHSGKRRGVTPGRKRDGRATPRGNRPGVLQFGKLKTKVSKEERMKKRKREEEELEVYNAQAKRKSTNNRKERGSIRDRRPHVMFGAKLEQIRAAVESRPFAGHFKRPVNRKVLPRYYEVISNPIDLQTIRNKISKNEYRKSDTFLKDFELMKNNAIKFNGESHPVAVEAIAIHEFVRDQLEVNQSELSQLEEAVAAQMDTTKNKIAGKKSKGGSDKKVSLSGTVAGSPELHLGDIGEFMLDDSDSGEDDEIPVGS